MKPTKAFGAAFLPLFYTHFKTSKEEKRNECNVDAHAMQDDAAL